MRWIPASHSQTAGVSSCAIPTSSEHQKLRFAVTDSRRVESAFVHPALQKHDLLPTFATTRVAKRQNSPRPAPEGQKSDQVAASTFEPRNPAQSLRSTTAVKRARHTTSALPPTLQAVLARPLVTRRSQPPQQDTFSELAGKSETIRARPRQPSRMLTQIQADRPHHTPPFQRVETDTVPLPKGKPPRNGLLPAKIGTIEAPVKVIEPAGEQALKTQPRAAATAGFAIGRVATRASSKSILNTDTDKRAPVFRRKPDQTTHPINESRCLSLALYYEVRNESTEAQIGLTKVIMSRVKSKQYPNTICGVVYQNAHLRGRCAFSFACDGLNERPNDSIAWSKSRLLALRTVCGDACLEKSRNSHTVRKAQLIATHGSARGQARQHQVTDRGMKTMGRDGVNAFTLNPRPLF